MGLSSLYGNVHDVNGNTVFKTIEFGFLSPDKGMNTDDLWLVHNGVDAQLVATIHEPKWMCVPVAAQGWFYELPFWGCKL